MFGLETFDLGKLLLLLRFWFICFLLRSLEWIFQLLAKPLLKLETEKTPYIVFVLYKDGCGLKARFTIWSCVDSG